MITGRRRIALMAAGLATASVAAGAVAATGGDDDTADDLAAAINERAGTRITAEDVTGAFQDLLAERLDEALSEGRLTREEADRMLARAKAAPGLPGPGSPGHGRGPGGPGGPHAEVLDDAAKRLGLTEAQVRRKLEAGSTLTAIATAEGVTRAQLVSTLRAALRAEGVPAARTAELAAHIADHEPHERGGRGPRGMRP